MKTTISDIMESINEIEKAYETQKIKARIDYYKAIGPLYDLVFEAYLNDPEIKAYIDRLENCDSPDAYGFEDDFLMSFYRPKFDVSKYPLFYEFIDRQTEWQYSPEENSVSICHGHPITINLGHDRNCYFVYDLDMGKPIVESERDIVDERHLALILESYQRKTGCFGDIVKIDYYGNYIGHYFSELSALSDSEIERKLSEFRELLEASKEE